MPPRSKVITMLPPYIRQEVERRLFENGFRDYEGLAQWVRGQGYEISDDSLWRYGHSLQQQLAAVHLTVRLAGALGELADDHELLMARVLMTIAQQKALASLAEKEEVEPGDLNAIANLTRAVIAQQRWAAQLKAQGEPQHQAAADRKRGTADKTQPSRNPQRAIAPLAQGRTGAVAAPEELAGRSDPPRQTSPGDEGRPATEQHRPETGSAVNSSSMTARDGAVAASIQPALYCASPRIAAEHCASGERAIPFLNSGLLDARSPGVERAPTQIDAGLRT